LGASATARLDFLADAIQSDVGSFNQSLEVGAFGAVSIELGMVASPGLFVCANQD